MESQLKGHRAQSDTTKSSSNQSIEKPIFKISSATVNSEGKANTLTVTVDTNKKESNFSNSTEDPSKLKAVKAVVYKIVRVYESRPPNTMKYLGIVAVLLLFVGILAIAFAQEQPDENTQSKYGMAFTLGEPSPASSASSEKIVAAPPAPDAAASIIEPVKNDSSSTETMVTTVATKPTEESTTISVEQPVDNNKSDEKLDNQNEPNEPINNRPSMVIENDEEEKSEEDQNPRIVFIERLMGLHLSAPLNKPDGEQKSDTINEPIQANAIKNDKVNAKWASRMRKFTIPIPNQTGEPQGPGGLMPPPPPPPSAPEHPMLRYAAAAMMSRLIAAAARAQMEAQAREAIMARSNDKDDDNDDGPVPALIASLKERQELQSFPHMYGRPMPRPTMIRPPVAPFQIQQQQQQQRQVPVIINRNFIAPGQQRPNIPPAILQRRIAPSAQPVVVMLALPIKAAESQQQPRRQMPFYPSVPYTVPVVYRHQVPAASVAMPIQLPLPTPQVQYVQRPAYLNSYAAQPRQVVHIRPVVEVPVEAPMHYPVQHQVIAIRPQMANQVAEQRNDHHASSSEPGHMILLYDAEVHHEDADDLEPSASEDSREQSYHRAANVNYYHHDHLPPNPSPAKIKLIREFMNLKHAAQTGVRYIPVSVASADEQAPAPVNHFVPQRRFGVQRAQESVARPSFVVLAHHAE